jgi:hypothetical protein
MSKSIRLEHLLGREVHTANNRALGRLEEFRAEQRGREWIVTAYLIGASGLAERLGLGMRLILGMKLPAGYVARWDQMDLSNPDYLRISCPVEDLQRV